MRLFVLILLIISLTITGIWTYVLYQGSAYENQLLELNIDAEADLIIETEKVINITKISSNIQPELKTQLQYSRESGDSMRTLNWIMQQSADKSSDIKKQINNILLINIISYNNNRNNFNRIKINYHDDLNNPILKVIYTLSGYPHYY